MGKKKKVAKVVLWTFIAVVAVTLFWTINREGAILNVSEAFFRYIFKNNAAGLQGESAKAYFLRIEGKDPSPKLLTRFKRHSPPVKKGSEFVHEIGVIDEGERVSISERSNGILFRIDSYKWYGNIVVIRGGYYQGSLSASWATYTWIQIAGIWILIHASPAVVA